MRTASGPLAVAGLVLLSVAARIAVGREISTPFILVDELIHGGLARSVREGFSWHVRGERMMVTFLYPLLIAPAWLAESMDTVYGLAKALNAVWMSLAAVPVYLWGRRLVAERWAVAAAALTLLMPSMVFTGTLMAENVFLPAFLLFAWALWSALERPTLARQALVLGAAALCVLVRVQGLIALPILTTTVVAYDVRRVRAWWPTALVLAVAAIALVTVPSSLGVYGGVDDPHYTVGALAKWLVYETGVLALAVGVVPLVALAFVRERAFLAVAGSCAGWLLALATVSSLWTPVGIKERYMLHAMPLLFLALALWVERGLPRPRWAIAAASVPALAAVALPLHTLFREPSLLGNAFGLLPFYRLSLDVGGARVLVVALAIAAAAAVVALPARWAAALPVAIGVYLLVANVPVVAVLRNHALGVRELANLDPEPSWIDIRADGPVAYVNTSNYAPETLRGDLWSQWAPVWEAEFWNHKLERVISLEYPEPAPLPQVEAKVDWATGELAGAPRQEWIVARRGFEVDGEPRSANRNLVLWRAEAPLRLNAATEGVSAEGRMQTVAAYTRWRTPNGRAGWIVIEIDGRELGRAHAAIGPLTVRDGVGAIARVTNSSDARVQPDLAGGLLTPRPPFRLELRVDEPGARVSFRFTER
jgi:hypothetical protein